jgi:hypothetical protein
MSNVRITLGNRLKSFRQSISSNPGGPLTSSKSDDSFTSFPIDPQTKAPIRPSSGKAMPCSPSWKLIVALNQSEDEPEKADETKLRDFARRSLHRETVEPTLRDAIAVLNKGPDALPLRARSSIRTARPGSRLSQPESLPQEPATFSEAEHDLPKSFRRPRRLSHRVSFTALSTRCSWFRANGGGSTESSKRNYCKMDANQEEAEES